MSDTSLAFNFLKGRDTATPHMKKVGDSAGVMGSRIKASSIMSVAATATMVAGWASLAAQGVAAVAAVSPLLGLVATAPALMVAAAGGVGVLVMAFSGLGAALKHTAGSAGTNGQAIAAAEHQVEMAQRGATQAQLGLNDARAAAAGRLIELTRLLAHAALDERAATLAVADAQKQLRVARQSGDRSAVEHAQLGYEEAVLALEDVKLHTQDLHKEEDARTKAGIEGSVEVKSALQQQVDAMYNLAAAQAALAAASKGSGGVDAAAAAYAKLSAAGKDLVDVLKAIAPQWRGVQQAVQQTVFAGVAGDVKQLSDAYLPRMKEQLPAIAQGWNNAFRGSLQMAASKDFVDDVNTSLGNTATFWQRIGNAFAPFLNGFNQFVTVGSSFLPGIGSWVERGATAFERWAIAARDSGKAHDWMQNALTVLSQLWEILKNLGSSVAAIFRAGDAGPGWLPGVVAGTQALSDFLNSPAGQGKIAEIFGTIREVGSKLWAVLTNIGPALLNAFSSGGAASDTMTVFGAAIGFAADHIGFLTDHLPLLLGLFIAYKTITAGAVVVETIRIPLLIAQTISNFALAGAMRATMVATGQATTAQWGLNLAFLANPVGLIIIAIIALVAGFILLWQNSAGFRDFFIGMWDHIWGFLKMIGAWFAGPFVDFFVGAWHWIQDAAATAAQWIVEKLLWLVGLPGRVSAGIAETARGMWDGIVNAFKAAINWMIRLWNDFHLTLGGGTILGVSIPSVTLSTPDIPYLESGGTITRGGAAIVADRNGQGGEVVSLPRGAQVTPLSGGSGGEQKVTVHFDFTGADQEFVRMFRKIVKVYGGGNVQVMAS